jgi:hypothetical protein
MAGESKVTYKGKITLGASNILGMGTWTWTGMSRAMLDDSEFGDEGADYLGDMLECGKITASGNFKKDDTTGQDIVRSALINDSNLIDIRFYVDATSYYTPNSTTAAGGGLLAGWPVGHVKVESFDIDFSGPKGNLGKFDFSAQVCRSPLRLI